MVSVGAGRTRVYEYPRTPVPPLRSHEDCLALGKRALQTKKVCEHIPLRYMCNFIMVNFTCSHVLVSRAHSAIFQYCQWSSN